MTNNQISNYNAIYQFEDVTILIEILNIYIVGHTKLVWYSTLNNLVVRFFKKYEWNFFILARCPGYFKNYKDYYTKIKLVW